MRDVSMFLVVALIHTFFQVHRSAFALHNDAQTCIVVTGCAPGACADNITWVSGPLLRMAYPSSLMGDAYTLGLGKDNCNHMLALIINMFCYYCYYNIFPPHKRVHGADCSPPDGPLRPVEVVSVVHLEFMLPYSEVASCAKRAGCSASHGPCNRRACL